MVDSAQHPGRDQPGRDEADALLLGGAGSDAHVERSFWSGLDRDHAAVHSLQLAIGLEFQDVAADGLTRDLQFLHEQIVADLPAPRQQRQNIVMPIASPHRTYPP